jgi:Domain of unknown function (DUF4349)
MRPLDDDADFEAQLRSSRPQPRPEFRARLDAQVASGFPRWPRLLGALKSAARRANIHLAPIQAWISRRSMRAIEAAGSMQGITLRSVALWASVIATGLALGAGLSTMRSTQADRWRAYSAAPSQPYSVQSAVPVDGVVSDQSRFADRRSPPALQPDVTRSTWLSVEPTTAGVDATVAEVAKVARAHNGIVDRSAVHDGGESAWAVVQLRIPDASLNAALSLLSEVGEMRSRSESTLREVELRSRRRYLSTMTRELAAPHKRNRVSRVLVWITVPASVSSDHRGGAWSVLANAPRTLGGVAAVGFAYLARFVLAWMLARLTGRQPTRSPRRRTPANVR